LTRLRTTVWGESCGNPSSGRTVPANPLSSLFEGQPWPPRAPALNIINLAGFGVWSFGGGECHHPQSIPTGLTSCQLLLFSRVNTMIGTGQQLPRLAVLKCWGDFRRNKDTICSAPLTVPDPKICSRKKQQNEESRADVQHAPGEFCATGSGSGKGPERRQHRAVEGSMLRGGVAKASRNIAEKPHARRWPKFCASRNEG
jgi:hypothetical protein